MFRISVKKGNIKQPKTIVMLKRLYYDAFYQIVIFIIKIKTTKFDFVETTVSTILPFLFHNYRLVFFTHKNQLRKSKNI